MSETSTVVTPDYFQYLAERTTGQDAFLTELKAAATAAGIPSIWIAPEQASLMQILLRGFRVREVVEVGTLAGYSAISMARALPPEGRVRTIELDAARVKFTRSWVARSDAAGKVEVFEGAGTDVLTTFASDSADAAFIDADKPNYPRYLKECMRIVRRGGLIMADNAFAYGRLFESDPEEDVKTIRAFNDQMARTRELQSVIVPIGDGLWVGVRL
jgi:predicted O-methyltransferase YrrM